MSLAQDTNRYLDEKSPWKIVKTDREKCATALFVSLSVIDNLKMLFYPFLPFSSEKLHHLLGYKSNIRDERWGFRQLPVRQKLATPEALFTKLDESVVAQENAKLGSSA